MGMDVHARNCVLGDIDYNGNFKGNRTFQTSEQNIINTLKAINAKSKYPEIKEFKKMPGIGEILLHVFDAFIQTPHRFTNKRQLWRYCRLGIIDHSSDGKPLGYKRLDRSGISELKSLTYQAWMSTLKGDNEVKRFYSKSLQRTFNRVHARLNTQRKTMPLCTTCGKEEKRIDFNFSWVRLRVALSK